MKTSDILSLVAIVISAMSLSAMVINYILTFRLNKKQQEYEKILMKKRETVK